MELVSAVVGPIIDKTVGAVGRQIGYVYHSAENVQNLRHKVEELSIVIGNIQGKIEDARNVGDIIRHEASDWQEKATRSIVDAENFLNEQLSDGRESCLKGTCPNICSRYVIGKQAKKETTVVVQLVEHGNMFQTVSRLSPLPSFESRARNSYFEAFESRKSVFEDIMRSFKDETVRVIGIYGSGGVGKTAMADKVGAQAEKDHIFDEIVKAVVTQNPDVGKIQDELAAQLNLKLNHTTAVGNAIHLCKRLTNGKKILLILDDVWKELDLNGIGIPFANGTQGCQILLTTRSESVCQEMRVNKKIRIGFLSDKEAWILFRRQVENDIPPDVHEVAKQVCTECAGLPIAILAIGRMLNGKASFVWADVLEQLKQSQLKDIPGIDEKVYASLVVSYHNLDSDDAKSCFLFCCLFPEDFNIPTEYILRYGKGVGVPKEMKTLSRKRDRVRHLVDYLKRNCLLLEGGDEEHVKMHDVIRDVAISIASEGQHMFLSEMEGDLNEWPRKETYDCYTAISVEFNKGSLEFPDNLDCAKLNTLLLSFARYQTLKIPQTLFHGMKKLKVLIFKGMKIPEFPASITSLVDMKVLCLENCYLGELSWVGNLRKLELLILQYSYLNLLPAQIGELSHLRLLDLRDCKGLKSISPGVISSLSRLEELFLPLKIDDKRGLQSNLAELKDLSQLEALEMHVPANLKVLPQDFGSSFWDKLAKFRISINGCLDKLSERELVKNTLKLKGVSMSGWTAVLLKRVEILYLEELNASDNLKGLYDEGRGSFPKLLQFEAAACHGITEFLSMVVDERSVSYLTIMKIVDCNMEYILSPSMVKGLTQLQILEIMSCMSLKSIVGGWQESDIQDIQDVVIFHRLKEINLSELPLLVSFYPDFRKGCALQPLFTEKVQFPNLEALEIHNVGECREISVHGSFSKLRVLKVMEMNSLMTMGPTTLILRLQNLRELVIGKCNSLRAIFDDRMQRSIGGQIGKASVVGDIELPALYKLEINNCCLLDEFYGEECSQSKDGLEATVAANPDPTTTFFPHKVGLPKLRELSLGWMDSVKDIWTGGIPPSLNSSSLCNLTLLKIDGCHNLVRAIPPVILPSLHQLELLNIQYCDSLREVVGSEAALSGGAFSVLPRLKQIYLRGLPKLENLSVPLSTFQSLSYIEIEWCGRLSNLFSSPSTALAFAPNLHNLRIENCEKIKEIVSWGSIGKDVAMGDHVAAPSPLYSLQIIFPHLKYLILGFLPRLTSLCPSGYLLFRKSSLKRKNIIACPNLQTLEPNSNNKSVQFEETLQALSP